MHLTEGEGGQSNTVGGPRRPIDAFDQPSPRPARPSAATTLSVARRTASLQADDLGVVDETVDHGQSPGRSAAKAEAPPPTVEYSNEDTRSAPGTLQAVTSSSVVTIACAKVGPLISWAVCIPSRLRAAVASLTRVVW